jgi:hypothetical protein
MSQVDKDLFITRLVENFFDDLNKLNVIEFCHTLNISKQTYYNYLKEYAPEINQAIDKVKLEIRLASMRQLKKKVVDDNVSDKALELGLKVSGDLQETVKINGLQIVIKDQTDEDFQDKKEDE